MVSDRRARLAVAAFVRHLNRGGTVDPFRRPRLGLTALYLLAAAALIAVVGGGTYRLLDTYFRSTTDQALAYRMTDEFRSFGLAIPPDLAAAENWPAARSDGKRATASKEPRGSEDKATADADLVAIFAMPLDSDFALLLTQQPTALPMNPDLAAANAAMAKGTDWRTITLSSGRRVRLFSYRVGTGTGPTLFQLGRTLDDQDRVLSQILGGLYWLSGLSVVLVGAAAWWLAGRSLRPARQAWERQRQFVANASHELRTPLTLISATVEVARRGLPSADADQRALLDDALHECQQMGRLVEDLLLLSRLDAGQLVLERQPVSVHDLLAEVSRQVGRLAVQRDLTLELDSAEGAVLADPARLRQVLLILLDNSIRHTPAGGLIRLSSELQGRYIALSVADTGAGISPEHLTRIFERFYRADSARGAGGNSGLGLAIARELIEKQQGTITISSTIGMGTRVAIQLPSTNAA